MTAERPDLLLTNARIATMADAGTPYGLIEDGAVAVKDGVIAWAGPMAELARFAPDTDGIETRDLKRRVLTPGLIDCHTHIVYGGNRSGEFEERLNGVSYAEISKRGGGIAATVAATRAESEEELEASALRRHGFLRAEGVTTLEIKSGYGLDTETENKMLRVARKIGAQKGVDVMTSHLGAHALPPEYTGKPDAFIDAVCNEMLPASVEAGLVDAVDGFCEGIAFSVEQMERVFDVAHDLAVPIKLHAEQLSNLGGAAMAARRGALSADHLEYLDEAGVDAMAEAGTVAVLLPGAFYYLRETKQPPLDYLRQKGVPVAVATDLNPGSSPVHSLLSAMNMSCVLFSMTPHEVVRGVTCNAARALGLVDRGSIEAGKRADFALWNISGPGELCYPLGANPCAGVYKDGQLLNAGECKDG